VQTVAIDGSGWASADFDDLQLGLTYGLRWSSAEAQTTN
jgi:hypothetical protein